ncbi:hypothetical protein ACFFMN_22820 [Planobispora siamensis]|uniref:Uncharacterized protein n=1 Tax=Planobispora siamensis TaxID=936338 RepID=A0A8J3SLK1_9ACTN|nr:hypothetical protein [Planobispora siamensis]GIH95400.1 hypothetical protein Psi01_60300 [Planobispora siamensis]
MFDHDALWRRIPRGVRTYIDAREPYFHTDPPMIQAVIGRTGAHRKVIITPDGPGRYGVEIGRIDQNSWRWQPVRTAVGVEEDLVGATLTTLFDQAGDGMPLPAALDAAYTAISPATRSELGITAPSSDPRTPAQYLTFHLDSGALPGRTIRIDHHPATGHYTINVYARDVGDYPGQVQRNWVAQIASVRLEQLEADVIALAQQAVTWRAA